MQINRFSNIAGTKIKTTIWPDDILELPTGDKYSLSGIGHHLGENHASGHFIASLKLEQNWVKCNDTNISHLNENDAKSLECNVCVYSKLFDTSTPFVPTDDWQHLHGRKAPGGLNYCFGLMGNYARSLNNDKYSKSNENNMNPQNKQGDHSREMHEGGSNPIKEPVSTHTIYPETLFAKHK